MADKKRFYLGTLERFGYELTAIGFTEKDVKDTLKNEYIGTFIAENEVHPSKSTDGYGDNYLEKALEDINIWELEVGAVEWR